MKTSFKLTTLALGVLLMSFAPINQKEKVPLNTFAIATKIAITWKSVDLELGEIEHNKPKVIEFEFTNTGEASVIILNVQAGCGCTATTYSKEPIAPGKSAKITATYNAASMGAFKKTVMVNTNAEETPRTLTFKGVVI
jgi:hypothetical protein